MKSDISELKKNGVYRQKEEGLYMVRARVLAGELTAKQLLKLAELADKYGDSTLHLTTRQNVEFHSVEEENLLNLFSELAIVGITTRGSGGNTVKSVTACFLSGVCDKEIIRADEVVKSITENFVGNNKFEHLPRKFQISVSGCECACGLPQINDIGLVAKKTDDNRLFFEAYIAGGLGKEPSKACKLFDRIDPDKVIPFIRAILEVFNKYGDRENFSVARMKFLLAKLGEEKLKRLIAGNFNPDMVM